MRRPGIVRDCEHPGHPHEHGEGCYRYDQCRCPLGRAWSAKVSRERRKAQILGTWKPAKVPAIGSLRRLEALMCLGYDLKWQADRVGISRKTIEELMIRGQKSVMRETAEKIAKMYDELWNVPAPATNKSQRISVSMSKGIARRRGYFPPAAWDDDTIDDPNAVPDQRLDAVLDVVKVKRVVDGKADGDDLTQPEREAAAKLLLRAGHSQNSVIRRLRMGDERVRRLAKEAA